LPSLPTLTAFSGAFFNSSSGQAVFAGPNIFLKLWDSAALNLPWTSQVTGKAYSAGQRSFDLDNFERYQVRLMLTASF
jgi:hypothetical protein